MEVLRQAIPDAHADDELPDLARREIIRPIVVMVPDPTQSHMALYFDQAVVALLRAAARAKFSREPTSLPWRAVAAGQASDDRAQHGASRAGQQLGILLFRAPEAAQGLVAFLLVPESPVIGAPFELLADAYRLAEAVRGRPAQTRQLDILGPFFSGSGENLAQTLLRWHERGHQDWSIRVLTGTATAFSLGELNSAPRTRSRPWTFQRTVADDDALLRFVRARLEALHVPGRGAPRIATLEETGTHYALELDALGEAPPAEQLPSASGASESVPASGASAAVVEYWFPLHISQIRTAREADGKSSDAGQVQSLRRTLALEFDPREEHDADNVPVLSALTRYEVELSLSQVLERICRDRVQYLVLAARDPADQLFVAGEARRYCPDLVLVSLGGDELMLHPDLRAVFNGALVASSYPLAFQSSAWTRADPREPLLQFASPIAEGFYNAAVAFIDPDPAHALDEYHVQLPGSSNCPSFGPRLWLSMADNGNFWPVAADCAPGSDFYEPAVGPETDSSAREGRGPELRASGFAHGVGLLLLFGLSLHALAALLHPARTRFGDLFVPRKGRLAAVQARYVLGAHASLLLFAGSTLAPAFYLWWHAPALGLLRPALVVALVAGTLLCVILLCLSWVAACAAWRCCRRRGTARWHATLVTVFTLLVVLALGAAVGARTWHWRNTWSSSEGLLAAARILDPLGACSLAPAFYLALGFYTWSICGLRRVRQLNRFSVCWPLPRKRPVPAGSDRALLDSLQGIWW
ncbi:MAG TPA: hypothetical protein VG963_28775, partial [Polyangiaceae bacterium]|nr:hypothetical protein [Polyangiaceae bacterium]